MGIGVIKYGFSIIIMLSVLKLVKHSLAYVPARPASMLGTSRITKFFKKRKSKKEQDKFKQDYQLYEEAGENYNLSHFEKKIKNTIQTNSGIKERFAKNKNELAKYKQIGITLSRNIPEGLPPLRKKAPTY